MAKKIDIAGEFNAATVERIVADSSQIRYKNKTVEDAMVTFDDADDDIEDVPSGSDDDPGTVSPSIPTILLSELDALIQPGLSNSQDNYYKVLDYENGHVVGVLMVFSDNMGHVITQVFTTHYDNPGTWNSHRDDEIYVYYRSYKVGGTLDIPQFSWTDWKKLSNSGQIVIPFATSEVYGTVKLGSDIEQSIAAQEPQSVAARTYPIQKDKDGKLVVNVPWTGDGSTPMLVFDGIVSGDITAKSNSTVNNDGIYWAENEGQFVCKDGDEYYLGWIADDRYKGLPIDYANCSLFVQSPRTAVSIGAQVHAIYAKVAKKQPTSDYKTVLEKVGEIYANATPSSDGLMSKEDKVKLNSALTGDGVSSVKVVTEMPEEQESNVLYIVTGEE